MTTSFKQLESDFQRTLNEYKSTYKDYMVELNHQNGAYWNTEENVTVSNRLAASAKIPFLTDPDISKEECLHSCSSDKRCKYVLFSDSGNGECAANQCLKWTKDAAGLVPATSTPKFFDIYVGNSNTNNKVVTLPDTGITVYPTALNEQCLGCSDTFKVSVDGNQLTVTRTDQDNGWGQMLKLQGVKNVSGFKEFIIDVGSSETNEKTVSLPTNGITVNASAINRQQSGWSDKFSIVVNGDKLTVTRTDQNTGWDQNLQLRGVKGTGEGILMSNKACAPGKGPLQTNYVYSGWEKPTWKDSNNMSFMGDPSNINSAEWIELGSAQSLIACKDMSITSTKGPFGSVVFVANENKCYGGVPNATRENVKMEGVYSSIPPMGSTNLGGTSTVQYVDKLKSLNDELKNILYKMRSELDSIEVKDNKIKGILDKTKKNIQVDYKKLNEDRIKLKKMEEELKTLDFKVSFLERLTSRENIIYMGSIIMIIAIFALIMRKSS